jgi:hypothetical protein
LLLLLFENKRFNKYNRITVIRLVFPAAGDKACLARTVLDVRRTVGSLRRTESYRGAVIARNEAIANKTKTQGRMGDCGLRRNDGLLSEL